MRNIPFGSDMLSCFVRDVTDGDDSVLGGKVFEGWEVDDLGHFSCAYDAHSKGLRRHDSEEVGSQRCEDRLVQVGWVG